MMKPSIIHQKISVPATPSEVYDTLIDVKRYKNSSSVYSQNVGYARYYGLMSK
jgi:hypothetical protein